MASPGLGLGSGTLGRHASDAAGAEDEEGKSAPEAETAAGVSSAKWLLLRSLPCRTPREAIGSSAGGSRGGSSGGATCARARWHPSNLPSGIHRFRGNTVSDQGGTGG